MLAQEELKQLNRDAAQILRYQEEKEMMERENGQVCVVLCFAICLIFWTLCVLVSNQVTQLKWQLKESMVLLHTEMFVTDYTRKMLIP